MKKQNKSIKDKQEQLIDLDSLTKKELINIIMASQQKENSNRISISDFIIETNESLYIAEQTINRLISKHKSFVELRKKKELIDTSMLHNMGIG